MNVWYMVKHTVYECMIYGKAQLTSLLSSFTDIVVFAKMSSPSDMLNI